MEYTLVRSRRKTISIQITPEGRVVVRAPMRMAQREIERFLQEKSGWISAHLSKVNASNQQAALAPLTEADIRALAAQARQALPVRVQHFAARMGVTYGRITVRCQSTRWGSCSSQGNLNFNCLLMLAPPEVLDYVIVHELAHRKQMNHSAAFWAEVAAVLPDYRERLNWLKTNGGTLLARARQAQ